MMFTVVFGPVFLAGLSLLLSGAVSMGLLMPFIAVAVFSTLFLAGLRTPS